MKLVKVKHRKKMNPDDGMIPLINIVFLMLIFFMVAGHIESNDPIKTELPSSISDLNKDEFTATVVMNSAGKLAFNQQLIRQEELSACIEKSFAASKEQLKFNLLVKVDQNLSVKKLRSILSIIKKTGIKRIELATQKSP